MAFDRGKPQGKQVIVKQDRGEEYKKKLLSAVQQLKIVFNSTKQKYAEEEAVLEAANAKLREEQRQEWEVLGDLQSQSATAKADLDLAKATLEQVTKQIETAQAQSQAELTKRANDVLELTETAQAWREKIRAADAQVDAAHAEVLNASALIAQKEAAIADFEKRLSVLQDALNELNTTHSNTVADIQIARQELTQVLNTITARQYDLDNIERDIFDKNTQRTLLSTQLRDLSAAIAKVGTDQEANSKRSAELLVWEKDLKVWDKALANKANDLLRKERLIQQAQDKTIS